MDFILSKIISRPLRGGDDNCDKLKIVPIRSRIECDVETTTTPACDDNTNKTSSSAKHSTLGLDSEISDIDTTLSPGLNTTVDTSYTENNLNFTCSDLINGLGGLKLNTTIVGNRQKANHHHHHIDANASSDDDLFQECENDLEESATAVHSTIDKNGTAVSVVSNESFNFPSNVANSTAATALNVTPNFSQANDKSNALTPIVAESSAKDFISEQESPISNNAIHSTSVQFDDANRAVESSSHPNDANETIYVEIAGSTSEQNESPDTYNLNATVEVTKAIPEIVINSPEGSNLNVTAGSIGDNSVSNSTHDLKLDETVDSTDLNYPESSNVTSTNQKQQLNETVDLAIEININETSELASSSEDAAPGNSLHATIELASDIGSTPKSNLTATVELPAADSTTVDENILTPVENVLFVENPLANETIELSPKSPNVVAPDSIEANPNVSETVAVLNTTIDVSESNIAEEMKTINTTFEPPTLETQPIISMQNAENVANGTFEPMDVDMNDTANFPPPPPEILSSASNEQSMNGNESLFNQTIDMKDCSEPTDDVPAVSKVANMNVTIDAASTTTVQSPSVASPFQVPFRLMGNRLNKTQVSSEEPKNKVELNKTVELEAKLENLNQTIELSNRDCGFVTNQTFIADNDQSPMNILNQTQNLDFSSFPAARRPINAKAQPSKPDMNETVVLDNNLPTVNTTFISTEPAIIGSDTNKFTAPKQSDELSKQSDNPSADKTDETFKVPQLPSEKVVNLFGASSLISQATFDIPDDEFQSPGLILNSTDFDFLLSKGTTNPGQNNPRNSILERFDPILGRKSVIYIPPLNSEATAKTVPTILETSIAESTSSDGNELLLSVQDSDRTIDLNQSTKLDQNISGEGGDYSQASSTTETYETASIGDPLKTDVTMSVGLIHDNINMDNMKSMEQDMKEQPNLKMNDEQNVNKDMIENVERKLKEAEAREEALLRRITEKEKALNKMSAVVENYEKTMVEMLSEREQNKQNYEKELAQSRAERDSNFHHLTSLESTFSDLHIKYEKSKQMALEVRDNEAKLKEALDFCKEQMKLQEQRYEKLKNHALTQLEGANSKLEAINKAHSSEIKKLTAQMKKDEISRQSIMDQLAQKTKENEELVKICDELINNGGS